ncbi:MAG: c-type cytochrome [Verrucomicrobiae bacterium]|nr:c-type cytochrome [Verrucomicrobiae bacterium]
MVSSFYRLLESAKLPGRQAVLFCWMAVFVWVQSFRLEADIEGSRMQVANGFKVERVYDVPRETEGSWVALCVDNLGRLITGDQTGGLYRINVLGERAPSVEKLEVEVGYVNGLVYAFDSLYAVVAEDEYQGGGLYRIRDLDGDDHYDDVQYLRDFVAKGEHGPHSVVLGPEGKWLYVVSGNKTPIPAGDGFQSLVPDHWGEDDLLPRLWGPIGSEKGTTAPGGWIARTDPEGKTWQLMAIGFRNAFDLAFNRDGELFTADADAEFDMRTPWYRPTRLFHVIAGTDYGWRSGAGKWHPYYPDTVPPVYEFGPGSPTGITFGYGTRFPRKYQEALFTGDWSWGRIFVTWLSESGATYRGETEEFLTGIPLPIADLVVNPFDGAMYFVLGGRGATSGLYRISYTGDDEDEPEKAPEPGSSGNASLRKPYYEFTTRSDSGPSFFAPWSELASEDRIVRHKARILLEQLPSALWQQQALQEKNTRIRLAALLALTRAGDGDLLPQILQAVTALDWNALALDDRLLSLRCLELSFIRMGSEDTPIQFAAEIENTRKYLESIFPSKDPVLNPELLKLLVFLKSEAATEPAMGILSAARTQTDKLQFIVPLRLQTEGWTSELRERFFDILGQAKQWKGGLSLSKYVEMIVADSLQSVPESDRSHFRDLVEASKIETQTTETETRLFVKSWTSQDLLPISTEELDSRNFVRGRDSFAAATCFACHRVNGEGGDVGPDLTAVMRRYSIPDLLEAILEPSKVISDQYGYTLIRKTDGQQLYGKVVNYYGDSIGFQVDPLNAAEILRIPQDQIESMEDSPVSPMPPGLLNTHSREEILDLLAFLQARGAP